MRSSRRYRRSVAPLKQETKENIIAIVLLGGSLLLFLGFVNAAGAWGRSLDSLLQAFFGVLKWLVPAALLWVGYHIAAGTLPVPHWRVAAGWLIMVASLFILIELVGSQGWASVAGGFVGDGLTTIAVGQLGVLASWIVSIGGLVVGLMFGWESAYQRIATLLRWIFTRLRELFSAVRVSWQQRRSITGEDVASADGEPPEDTSRGFRRIPVGPEGHQAPLIDEAASRSGASHAMLSRKTVRREQSAFPITLLEDQSSQPESGNVEIMKQTIERTFGTFGITVEMGEVSVGPTVTQYTLKPADGIKLSQITALHNDLALQLAAHPIRIEAPIPGKSLVGVEVPNKRIAVVSLKGILVSPEYRQHCTSPHASSLIVGVGRDVAGTPQVVDLARLPHLLLAGATGSGKTIAINTMIMSLLYQNTPEELRLLLVDPKRVELPLYNDIPHLITPVITDIRKTINALRWLIGEMDRRFSELSRTGHRDIASYNAAEYQRMPYLVVIIDELADLMATAANEVEACIIRLAQMARAVGIHLVLATQRPSVDVITGLIKANITARMAFAVASSIDSRTILDTNGAEKLLGRGDMLLVTAEMSKPKRIQGAFVSDRETKAVASWLREKGTPTYTEGVQERFQEGNDLPLSDELEGAGCDPLLEEAKTVIVAADKASASLLQRRLKIGYARAARILDLLEAQGVIGPGDGAKPREVLIGRGQDGSISEERDDFSTEEGERIV